MKTMKTYSRSQPIVSQVQNNTSLWIGHLQTDPTDHFGGQTFKCPSSGAIDNIQVFSAAVQNPGEMKLTLYSFNDENKTWGTSLVSAIIDVQKNDEEKWIRFDLEGVSLIKDEIYGFRLEANNAMIAVGEAVAGSKNSFTGEEWHGDSKDQAGHFYRYFSLAYKVEVCA